MTVVDESNPRYEGWRVSAACGVSLYFATLVVYTFPILLKPLSEEFSWSRQAVSSAYGTMTAMSAIAAAPFGYLADRLGPRKIIAPCLAIFGCAFASLSALTPHLWHLHAAFGLLGIVVTGASPVVYVRAISSWFERRRGAAFALALTGGSFAAVMHPASTDALIRIAGWRSACAAFGVLVLAIGVPLAARFIRERQPLVAQVPGTNAPAAGASVRQGLSSRVFWTLVIVLVGSSIANNGAIVHLAALLTDRGVPASRAAIAVSAMGGAAMAGRLLTGWLLDRFFAPRVSFALLASLALGTFLLAGARSFTFGIFAAALIGFGIGGESDVTPYLLSRYFGLRSFSTLYGLTWIANAAAAAVGAILMGRAFDATGSYETLLIQIAIATIGVATLMLTLPRYSSPYLFMRT